MKSTVCIALLFAFISISRAQTPINAARALNPLQKQGLLPSRQTPPPPRPAPAPAPVVAPAAPVYQAPPVAKKTNEPPAKVSKKLAVSKLEVTAAKDKDDGINGILYVTNLTDEVLAPFAEFTVLNTNKASVGIEFGRIRNLAAKEVGKMEINTTKTNAASLRLVKISSKLGED